ncbi:MAG TPA: CotH kinase family protein [Vicinamibacterales bacterium]|nr:CotH kinase family protein [Vicinamibacterales bacterium]
MRDWNRTALAAVVGIAVAVAAAGAQGPRGWHDDTHGRDAEPDYARVFSQDRVNRLDIRVSEQDWQRLLADMSEMAGPFGRNGGGGGRFGPLEPPPESFAACSGKIEGDTCGFGNPPVSGRCGQLPQARLACVPFGPGPGGDVLRPGGGGGQGGQGADDVEALPRTPIYVPARVVFDNTAFEHAGLRLKGNSSLISAWTSGVEKLPLRLNFDEFEREFDDVYDQTFFGFPNINLTNNAMDVSFVRAKVVGDLLRDAGLPAPRTAFVRVHLDRGTGPTYLGLYTLVEIPDRPMLNTLFGSDDGNLYKPNGRGARWTTFIRESFPKKTNAAEADWTDIEDAISALNARRDLPAAWRARLEARFEVDGFLRWLAFNTIIDNHDAYGGLSPHNYYLYGSPRHRDRLFWIPWDHDLAMDAGGGIEIRRDEPGAPPRGPAPVQPGGGRAGAGNQLDLFHDNDDASWPLIRFLLDDPVYRAQYRSHLEQLTRTVFEPSRLSARFRAAHTLIARDVIGVDGEQRGRTFVNDPADFDAAMYGPNGLLAWAQSRHAALLAALGMPR